MLCLLILVFSNLKSTTGLLSLVIFLVIIITGEVWLVVFLVKIPKDTSLCICQSIMGLSSSLMGKGLTKNGESSMTSMSILILGHSPISSLRLKAFLCCKIMSIKTASPCSSSVLLLRSIYLQSICSSVMFLLGSLLSSQGYWSGSADLACLTCEAALHVCFDLCCLACLCINLLN